MCSRFTLTEDGLRRLFGKSEDEGTGGASGGDMGDSEADAGGAVELVQAKAIHECEELPACAALRHTSGAIIAGKRHGDCFSSARACGLKVADLIQGLVVGQFESALPLASRDRGALCP
jgi:hypothetical protein